jgi:hypothetical protein
MNSNKEILKYYKKSRKNPKRFSKLHYIDEVQDMRGDSSTYLIESENVEIKCQHCPTLVPMWFAQSHTGRCMNCDVLAFSNKLFPFGEDERSVTLCNVCHKVNVCFTGIYNGCGPTCRLCQEKEMNIPPRKPEEWISRAGTKENPIDLSKDYGHCSNCNGYLLVPAGLGARHLCTPCYLDNLFGRERKG